jgi:hypothetical protein
MHNRHQSSPERIAAFKKACSDQPASGKKEMPNAMLEALNLNISDNVFPHWRQHPSIKGWQSMNYPAILRNPSLDQYKPAPKSECKVFSNLERPSSLPVVKINRPFTGMLETGTKFVPKKTLQSAALANIPENDLRLKLYASVPSN